MAAFNIYGYNFKPHSDNATYYVRQGNNYTTLNESFPIVATISINGTWSGFGPTAWFEQFQPGTYTVAVGTEWGALRILYFNVT